MLYILWYSQSVNYSYTNFYNSCINKVLVKSCFEFKGSIRVHLIFFLSKLKSFTFNSQLSLLTIRAFNIHGQIQPFKENKRGMGIQVTTLFPNQIALSKQRGCSNPRTPIPPFFPLNPPLICVENWNDNDATSQQLSLVYYKYFIIKDIQPSHSIKREPSRWLSGLSSSYTVSDCYH